MSHEHDHPHHEQEPGPRSGLPVTPPPAVEEAGTRALSEALRSSFIIVRVLMAVLVVVFFLSGMREVGPQERAVILRFGKPVGAGQEQLLGPGFHWSFPYPIDEVVKIPVGRIQTVRSTVGWYATTPEMEAAGTEPPAQPFLNPAADGYTLTADGNIIHARAEMDYRINDPLQYEFNFVGSSNVVQDALNNALVYTSSRFTVDRALRFDVIAFKEAVAARVNELVVAQQLGIELETLNVRVIVPRHVRPKFEEVEAAEADRNTVINKARGYQGELLNKALGESNAVVNTAMAEYTRRTNAVASEANYLLARLPEFKKNPELFRQRLMAETMERTLTKAQEIHILPDASQGGSRELRLLLNREPLKPTVPREGGSEGALNR